MENKKDSTDEIEFEEKISDANLTMSAINKNLHFD